MSPGIGKPPARSGARRKVGTLKKLSSGGVASAGAGGRAHLIPLSCLLGWLRAEPPRRARARTARNLIHAGWTRVALGPTRDAVIIEGPVAVAATGARRRIRAGDPV